MFVIAPLAACVDDAALQSGGAAAPLRTGSGAAEAACVNAVNTNYGAQVATVTSSDFSQANTVVMLTARGENWRCLTSADGVVNDVAVLQ